MEREKFHLEYIDKMAEEASKNTIVPYEDLPQYDLFLSQVIDYLNDKFKEEKYTNNIVQNYIKNEVISKPEDGKKRGYTKLHLAQLVLVSYMRPILTTDEIKKVFRLAFNHINDRSDDIISWEKAYKIFSDIEKQSIEHFLDKKYFSQNEFSEIMEDINLKEEDKERILVFLTVMTLISEASIIKSLVQKIVDEYQD